MREFQQLLAASLLCAGVVTSAKAVPVDIAFVVDQSVSMGGEFNWIPNVITDIDTALQTQSAVTSTRYGLAGYMEGAGNEFTSSPPAPNVGEYVGLAFQDLTASAAVVSAAAAAAAGDLRAATERGYHAADWSRSGFSWDPNAVKVMILLTDEAGDQGSTIPDLGMGSDEANLGQLLINGGFLLNVIAPVGRWGDWDQAVYDQASAYQGLFDLAFLRDNPASFTEQFVDAKVGEISGNIPTVPEPSTLALLAFGLPLLRNLARKA